jgi:hypothetical protein
MVSPSHVLENSVCETPKILAVWRCDSPLNPFVFRRISFLVSLGKLLTWAISIPFSNFLISSLASSSVSTPAFVLLPMIQFL